MSENLKKWSTVQNPEEINIGRYFEYNNETLQLFKKSMSFIDRLTIKVLEIGSGSGYFTDILLKIFPEINLTCLEPDDVFVEVLTKRFKDRIKIINEEIETTKIQENSYDVIISHIVLHNLKDPLVALKRMHYIVKKGGRVVVIEPLPSGRHYFSSEKIQNAADFLNQAIYIKANRRKQLLGYPENFDPWNICYPQLFEEIGFQNILCNGLTSMFTLSDKRINFTERKKWIKMRSDLVKNSQIANTQFLVNEGFNKTKIIEAYNEFLSYLEMLENSSEEKLNHVHEQQIVHRIMIIAEK